MSEKKKKIKATSPKGALKWFKFIKPDAKFKKYTADLIVEDTPELRKIMDKMEEVIQQTYEEAVEKAEPAKKKKIKIGEAKPIEEQLDAQGNHTGKYVMKFRMKSEGLNKEGQTYKLNPPALFNAKANPIGAEEKAGLQVYNGSIAQVAFEMSPYVVKGEAGVSFRPTACMLLKIQQADADASQFGFSAAEFAEEEAEQEESYEESADSNDDF